MAEINEIIARFNGWLAEAEKGEPNDATAMSLATVDGDGMPNVRMVLLKAVDAQGFVFYTNLESAKGTELQGAGKAALCFHWKSLRRQVRVQGAIEVVNDGEADEYFASRAKDSQIGAWASQQSRPLPDRFALEKAVAVYAAKYALSTVPRPAYWSGFRLIPQRFEFWQDKPFRLHDREVYLPDGDSWRTEKLFP
ncbi:MAG: pyridoxamine 5'-phosphate oxidase [Rhodospirillaceae bacterium]|jgi:pyridoxamine 5'-phosphate oxidase|nr:pyridoxamine 5'-phosphate oxidase [Rhodospirillaceae bacterium]MBT4045430.1 pyridoxamine 5'-phosphate oxidase [Rhodospirillaceae bacterium]MBT4691507.1 pyridoxamine 5'-phosphate oxidase [Rhodospirillaceae bacterium]MBT5083010.1 pyridoxamine 5'-phosphate oxidase [Rhodospirillaceae bacterium]MBT5524454.1 pyridoxamine 5'-phosphate oxidase [Rhodospirillaceae bacterium]